MAHVSEAKKTVVTDFVAMVKEFPIVGIVNMEGMPTKQVQNMRAALRKDGIKLHMTKKRIIKIILEEVAKDQKDKAGIDKLLEKLPGMPAMIFTNDNPFKLYKTLQKSKSPAPAKAGQIAPFEIIVPAGPTGFAPGPIIGEMGGVGIKAGIDGGKVAVKADSVVAKEGDVISAALAGILTRLQIMPMEIGLDLVNVYEDGNIFGREVLAIDEDQFMADLTQAHQWAFNLSVESGIMNSESSEFLLTKGATEARNLAVECAILNSDVVDLILAKASAHANAIDNLVQK